jgi:predicted transcriptional regulator
MTLTLELPENLEVRIEKLAEKTKQTKHFIAKHAIIKHINMLERKNLDNFSKSLEEVDKSAKASIDLCVFVLAQEFINLYEAWNGECRDCNTISTNDEKFSIADNHDPDCVYRFAYEVEKEMLGK